MDDDDFERTVEQLYAPGAGPKPYDGARNSTHVIELQPTRSGRRSGSGGGAEEGDRDRDGKDGEGRVTTTQPGPRPSMEARVRRSRSRSRSPRPERKRSGEERELEGDREQAILESRKGAKARTRDWIAQQSAHGSSADVSALRGESPQHQRGPSDSALLQHQESVSREGSHRAHQSEGHAKVQRPPEAYVGPQGRSGRVLIVRRVWAVAGAAESGLGPCGWDLQSRTHQRLGKAVTRPNRGAH